MPSFAITGGRKLCGEVAIGGSKNAALPILAATLLTDQPCVIKNTPDIEDIRTMLEILKSLGSEVEFKNHTVKIQTKKIKQGHVRHELGCKMRASVLLLGPLLAREGRARLPYPGGCVLGVRPIDTHINVLTQMGVKKLPSGKDEIVFAGRPRDAEVILPEFSVTATGNAIMAAAGAKEAHIRLAAVEPHVQDLCGFLVKMGVRIEGIGMHDLCIKRGCKLRGAVHSITPDYLEAGTFILAGVLTRGRVLVKDIAPHDLEAFFNLLRGMKADFKLGKDFALIRPAKQLIACERLQTNVFPGFPTDLQPPFAVMLTQAKGDSRIHETLFEGRFNYFSDLIKMGARIEKTNPHEAVIKGPARLRGRRVKSWDIRAGAAMILAGLAAKGKTTVVDIQYIDRGYENFDGKLRRLGADIVRIDS